MKRHVIKTLCWAWALTMLTGCSNFLFFPARDWAQTPDQHGYAYRDLRIPTAGDTELSAWLLPQRKADTEARGAVIFFHGNAENISTHIASVYWLTDAGYDVLLVDYRGYGHSGGKATLANSLDDIRYSIEWFLRHYPDTRPRFLLGQSIGASMSGYVLANRPALNRAFDGVVLDSGFAGLRRITREAMSRSWLTWWAQYPIAWTMPTDYDLIDHIHRIAPTPLLIVHGTEDTVVPYAHATDLYARAGQPKAMLSYHGPHIGAYRDPDNRQQLLAFLTRHAPTPPP